MPRRVRFPLLAAALCGGFALLVWVLAVHTGTGLRADYRLLDTVGLTTESRWWVPIDRLAKLCDPRPYALLAVVVLGVTFFTRGLRGVLVAIVILAGANVLAQVLKDLLATWRPSPLGHINANAWPSGHSTAAFALAACGVLAAPRPYRVPALVLAGAFVLAVSGSVVLLQWHFPSDALGGYAVGGFVVALAVAADRLVSPRGRRAQARVRPQAARQAAR